MKRSSSENNRSRFEGPVLQLGLHPTADLPLCSFGPGGGYVVDWQVKNRDLADARRRFPPRTLGSMVHRVAELMLWDLKGWLVAIHPGRSFRVDTHPGALDPCAACGQTSSWPKWLVENYNRPQGQDLAAALADDGAAVVPTAGPTEKAPAAPLPESRPLRKAASEARSRANGIKEALSEAIVDAISKGISKEIEPQFGSHFEPLLESPAASTQEFSPAVGPQEKPADDVPANYPFPFDCHGSSELEPVQQFNQSPAGRLIARLTAESRDGGTMRLFENDVLVPGGSSPVEEAAAPSNTQGQSTIAAQHTESAHDTHSQATQDSRGDSRLSASQRVFADHAGTRGPAQRLKSHNLRARRGARKEAAPAACPEQGSLFGGVADGEAA